MNIILTRPLNDIENLMNELFSLGHKIMHIPTLKIVNASLDPISIHNYKALIFTSSNAVRNIKIKEKRKNIKCFCVGSITEKIARASGFTEKITSINESNIELIRKYPSNVIFVYSLRSAESFNSIVANYSLAPMMTQSVVMCISKKIADFFNKAGWKNNKVFNPGNEIIELEKIK